LKNLIEKLETSLATLKLLNTHLLDTLTLTLITLPSPTHTRDMVRQYVQVTDEQRRELVRLIHEHNYSIAKASKATDVPYDNAKAINRTYLKENRIKKINYQ
jgi:hypothetical protein